MILLVNGAASGNNRAFTIYDVIINENATKQKYYWLKVVTSRRIKDNTGQGVWITTQL